MVNKTYGRANNERQRRRSQTPNPNRNRNKSPNRGNNGAGKRRQENARRALSSEEADYREDYSGFLGARRQKPIQRGTGRITPVKG